MTHPKRKCAAARHLEHALDLLLKADCCFWACEGPDDPQDMITCIKCQAIVEVRKALEALH